MTKPTELKLILSDKRKRVMSPSCVVKMDDTTTRFKDFVSVGFNEDGSASMINNADPVTVGIALMMLNKSFEAQMKQLTPIQQSEVYSVLKA